MKPTLAPTVDEWLAALHAHGFEIQTFTWCNRTRAPLEMQLVIGRQRRVVHVKQQTTSITRLLRVTCNGEPSSIALAYVTGQRGMDGTLVPVLHWRPVDFVVRHLFEHAAASGQA